MNARAVAAVALLLLGALPAAAQTSGEGKDEKDEKDDKGEIQARALFVEAGKRLDRGDAAGAVELYEEAYRRFPDNPKILLNLGTACVRWGRNAAAANAYQRYLDHPRADSGKRAAVKRTLADLDRKVAILEIKIDEPDARLRLDGDDIGQSPQTIARRVEIGPHLIAADKEGFTPSQATVTVAAGEVRAVELRLVRRADPPAPPAAPVIESSGPVLIAVEQRSTISHAGRLGLLVRLDIDGNDLGGGAVVAAGVTYGVASGIELGAAALLGHNFGAWGGASFTFGRGAWKPLATVGVPVYFLDSGALVGAHGAVGIEWNLSRSAAAVLAAGVQYYFGPPDGIVSLAFVPSLALSYRL